MKDYICSSLVPTQHSVQLENSMERIDNLLIELNELFTKHVVALYVKVTDKSEPVGIS